MYILIQCLIENTKDKTWSINWCIWFCQLLYRDLAFFLIQLQVISQNRHYHKIISPITSIEYIEYMPNIYAIKQQNISTLDVIVEWPHRSHCVEHYRIGNRIEWLVKSEHVPFGRNWQVWRLITMEQITCVVETDSFELKASINNTIIVVDVLKGKCIIRVRTGYFSWFIGSH